TRRAKAALPTEPCRGRFGTLQGSEEDARIAALFGEKTATTMFTGIIEALGVVESIQRLELNQAPVVRLVVVTDLDVETLPIGGSIAVDGVCLTIVERAVGHFGAD